MINNNVSQDPFGILKSAKIVADSSSFVAINGSRIPDAARMVRARLEQGLSDAQDSFGATGDLERDVQLVFLLDAVNFSFWPDPDRPRWQVTWPAEKANIGGWFSLVNVFKRAFANNVPVLDADYLSELPLRAAADIFIGDNGVQVPMLGERAANLREAGRVLNEKFGGKFINALEIADHDAVKIVKLLYDDFPSFRDEAMTAGAVILFLKRAQICANDLSYLFSDRRSGEIINLDRLTVFADYRLPQILREMGVLEYSPLLSAKIDRGENLAAGGREEIEIRGATIWAVESIRGELKKYNAAQIDNALWLLSQDQKGFRPHHRTRTIFY